MGFLTPVDRADGARRPRPGNSCPSSSLRNHELGPIGPNTTDSNYRFDKSLAQETEGRQISILAQLVRAIEPTEADRLARSLISEFGSLGQVLCASASMIARYTGNQRLADTIRAARIAVVEGLREEVSRNLINLRDPAFLNYLFARTQGPEENLHAVFIDSHDRYLSDERVASGDWTSIAVRLRPLLRRTVEIGAAKIVLCHNHPSGNPEPSSEDITFTREAARVARALGIELVDHLIVAGRSVFSMRTAGLVE
jgi:DNA repair protein RadC